MLQTEKLLRKVKGAIFSSGDFLNTLDFLKKKMAPVFLKVQMPYKIFLDIRVLVQANNEQNELQARFIVLPARCHVAHSSYRVWKFYKERKANAYKAKLVNLR